VQIDISICGTKVPLIAECKQTIQSVVERAMKSQNLFPRDVYFTVGGRVIGKDILVESANIRDGSVITVNPRLRGGTKGGQ
jgi:hypothetical protein